MLLHNQYEFNTNTDLIGSGGFARVYKAFDINLHRTVALKRFDKKDTKYSVLNEIRRCFDFNHPHIIRYLNCFQVESTNNFGEKEVVEFGVMEYADAGDFTQLIDKKVKRSADELKEIVIGILDGLQYLHTPNAMHQKPAIIHRDLKASNILFTTIGGKLIPKICDFGISKEIGSLGATTATGTGYLGTIEYMAPEQINFAKFGKDGKLQPNTDLWALGCMLYEYFTGKAPFGKRTDGDMQIDIQNKILDIEPSYPASIPLNYKEIIQKCLVKNAADRVQDATTLKGILLGNGEIKKIDSEISIAKAPIKIKKDWEVIPIGGNGEYIDGNISKEKKKEDNEYGEVFLGISFGVVALVMVAILYFANKKNEKNDISYDVATEEVATEYEVVDTFAMGGVHEFEFTNSLNEKFSYNGEFISGENGSDDYIPQGKGIAIYTNGEEYEGDFVNGIREGDGIYYWKEGEKYIGKYKNNKRNGYGKYYDANGNIIEQGFYVNGVLQ
jgi:serine/threonine protein kinase